MVSRRTELPTKDAHPRPWNMWACEMAQHKASEDVTKVGTSRREGPELPQWVQQNSKGPCKRGRLEGQRQRERPNSPADCQLLPHPFQIQAILDKLLVLQKEKTLTVEGPALPAPWEVNIAVKSWRVSEPTGTVPLKMGELDFLLLTTD